MEIIGRLTDEAQINQLTDGRQVVNFCVAINERYKTKDGRTVKETAYINCSYWITPNVAEYLHKGMIVSLYGSLSSKAYIDQHGEAQPVLNFHTNNIKFISKSINHEAL
jgi:single-strand DNA-binding protein